MLRFCHSVCNVVLDIKIDVFFCLIILCHVDVQLQPMKCKVFSSVYSEYILLIGGSFFLFAC